MEINKFFIKRYGLGGTFWLGENISELRKIYYLILNYFKIPFNKKLPKNTHLIVEVLRKVTHFSNPIIFE